MNQINEHVKIYKTKQMLYFPQFDLIWNFWFTSAVASDVTSSNATWLSELFTHVQKGVNIQLLSMQQWISYRRRHCSFIALPFRSDPTLFCATVIAMPKTKQITRKERNRLISVQWSWSQASGVQYKFLSDFMCLRISIYSIAVVYFFRIWHRSLTRISVVLISFRHRSFAQCKFPEMETIIDSIDISIENAQWAGSHVNRIFQ